MSPAAALKLKSEQEKRARARKYDNDILQMYYKAIDRAASAAQGITLLPGEFYLERYPLLNLRITNIIKDLTNQINIYSFNAIGAEWSRSDIDNDGLFDKLLSQNGKKSPLLNARNQEALQAFMSRVDGKGLNLSKRVFTATEQFKQELEIGLGDGIASGRSARAIASDLKQFLNQPDMLFRRVKQDGKLQLSKAALNYNPGQGVYRSSFKNALRVTRTEINMSYRSADNARYENSPFVIGVEVKTSDRHPTYDICDELAGDFPKTFVFIGWHPQCICYSIPILLTPYQFHLMQADLLAGVDITKKSYTQKPLPSGEHAKQWFDENKERISNWKSVPYFIRDNEAFFSN